MNAVDTNVVVRYLTNDDPRQAAAARDLVDGAPTLLITTVLLETEWVLRTFHKIPRHEVVDLLRGFLGLPTVELQDPQSVAQAFALMEKGADFADALHLAAAGTCDAFFSFDKNLIKSASASRVAVKLPPSRRTHTS